MPILACDIPAFPLALLGRDHPALLECYLALLSDDDHVLAATTSAAAEGVRAGQTARQARTRCPDLRLFPADLPAACSEFKNILALLDDYSDAVEAASLGRVYLDAPDLDAGSARPFCQDMGRQLRQVFGQALQPAIGCDSGKFTAGVAARRTQPGRVRVVLGAAERPFLQPLPVHLLPLSTEQQRFLGYLGIHTLGQFADLPSPAVFQQFGQAGRLAQQWALGRDSRPVIPRHKRPILSQTVDFDPAIDAHPPLFAATERMLAPLVKGLQDRLQATQHLQAILLFGDGQQRSDIWPLAEPTADGEKIMHLLRGRWQAAPWPAAVAGLTLTLSDIQETPGGQLMLFPGAGMPGDHLQELVAQLGLRYGANRLLRAAVPDPLRLRVEQRIHWQAFAA